MSDDPKSAWVKSFLGIDVGSHGSETEPGEAGDDEALRQQLRERIDGILAMLVNVAPEDQKTLRAAIKSARDLTAEPDLLAAEIAVEQLEDAHATAVRDARNADARLMSRDAVTYRKLRNAWQSAQTKALAELERLADTIVNEPPEEGDDEDTVAAVEAAAARVGSILPRFGNELEAILGDAELEPDAEARNALRLQAAAKIDDYLKELDTADVLAAVQSFADEEYGGFTPLPTLRGTLEVLAAQLRKLPPS